MRYALRQNSHSIYVDMEGDFTFNDSDTFAHMVQAINNDGIGAPNTDVCLDLAMVSKIDSSALDMLLDAIQDAKRQHMRITLAKAHGQVAQRLQAAAKFVRSLELVA